MYEESRNGGRGFAIYPSPLDESAQMRHAYFVYFPRVEVGSRHLR